MSITFIPIGIGIAIGIEIDCCDHTVARNGECKNGAFVTALCPMSKHAPTHHMTGFHLASFSCDSSFTIALNLVICRSAS